MRTSAWNYGDHEVEPVHIKYIEIVDASSSTTARNIQLTNNGTTAGLVNSIWGLFTSFSSLKKECLYDNDAVELLYGEYSFR